MWLSQQDNTYVAIKIPVEEHEPNNDGNHGIPMKRAQESLRISRTMNNQDER